MLRCTKGTACGGACIRQGSKCRQALDQKKSAEIQKAQDLIKKKIGLGVKIKNAQRKGALTEEIRLRGQRADLSAGAKAQVKAKSAEQLQLDMEKLPLATSVRDQMIRLAMQGIPTGPDASKSADPTSKPLMSLDGMSNKRIQEAAEAARKFGFPTEADKLEKALAQRGGQVRGELTLARKNLGEVQEKGLAAMMAGRETSMNRALGEQEIARRQVDIAVLKRFIKDIEKDTGPEADEKRRLYKEALSNANNSLDKKQQEQKTNATGNQLWARGDAKDFDRAISKEQLRRDGDQTFDQWSDTTKSGAKKLGEGAFGTVIKDPKGTYAVKRGDISDTEAKIVQKIGDLDLGPRLIAADIDGPGNSSNPGVDIRRGRIAMSVVPGNPIGQSRKPDDEIGGVKVADSYWTARAKLHRLGVAHNDMHIDNVLIDRRGNGRFVDMGLAQDNPKAALSEAMGAFNPPRGSNADRISARGAGDGDWQVRRYNGTGGKVMARAQTSEAGRRELQERAPVAARVLDNKNEVQYKMLRDGFSKDDIATVMDHGLRNPLSTYEKGVWSRMTNEQAQGYIDTLYDGV